MKRISKYMFGNETLPSPLSVGLQTPGLDLKAVDLSVVLD